MHSQKFEQNFWRNYKWTYLYLCTDNFYYYEREVHNFNWQGLAGWPKSIPHIVLVVHLHNLHAKPVNYDNIELLLKLKSSIEIARIIAASAERELQ